MNQDISKMAVTAVLVEGIVTYINEFFVSGVAPWQMILSLTLGMVVAISYKLDLPEYLNMKAHIPYIGCILTGVLISRGANYLYDLISTITSIN